MRFGIVLPHFRAVAGPAAIRDVAQAAESLGFDSIWITDRAAIPRGEVNRRFGPAFYDPLVTLGFVAAATSRVRLGATVFVLPFRHPVLMARAVASLDQLSGGRLDFGIGAGWMREEFAAIGVPFERRGALTDEYLDAMIALWTSPIASFTGPTVRFENLVSEPRPLQQPYPPIWVGGSTPPAFGRAVKYGQVWHASPAGLSQLVSAVAELQRTATTLGRDPATIALTTRAPLHFETATRGIAADEAPELPIGSPDVVVATLRRYQAAGFAEIVFDTFFAGFPELEDATPDRMLKTMQQFARVAMPAFR